MRSKITLLFVLASLLVCVPAAQANVIREGGWVVAIDANEGSLVNDHLVLDNRGVTSLVIEISKSFNRPPRPLTNLVDPIQVTFVVDPNNLVDPVRRIIISDEIICNRTGVAWTDYHWELFTYNIACFNKELTNVANGGWDISPFTFHEWGKQTGEESLNVSAGGTVYPYSPDGNSNYWYKPRGNLVIDISNMNSGDIFVLKQYPTIPEPGSMALVSLGGLVVMFTKRRKARA